MRIMMLMHFLDYPLLMMNKEAKMDDNSRKLQTYSMFVLKIPSKIQADNFLNPLISLHHQLQQGSLDHSLYSCGRHIAFHRKKLFTRASFLMPNLLAEFHSSR